MQKRDDPLSQQQSRHPYYGWVIVAVAGLLAFGGGTETYPVMGIFQGHMTSDFGWSRANFTAPMSIGTIIGGFLGLIVGPAMDRYGGRWIMGVAAVLIGMVFFLMGFVQELWQHYVLQILARAILTSTFFLAVSVIIPKWFVAKRGRATAFAGVGQRAGHVVLPLMVERSIALASWRTAWMAVGLMTWIITVVPVLLFLRRKPEDMGLLPDGVTPGNADASSEVQTILPGRREVSLGALEVIRHPSFYLILVAQSALTFVIAGVHLHWYAYLIEQGISSGVVVSSMAVSSLAGIPVSLAAGFMAERVPVRNIMAVSYLAMAATVALMLITTTPFMAYVFGIALGAVTGVTFTVSMIVWADYYGRESLGAIRGLISPVVMLTNSLGPLLAAVTYDVTGSYTFIIWLWVAVSAASTLLWVFARPPWQMQLQEELQGVVET